MASEANDCQKIIYVHALEPRKGIPYTNIQLLSLQNGGWAGIWNNGQVW